MSQQKIKNPLVHQLLRITFSICLIITITMTAIHMYHEWTQETAFVKKDLAILSASSETGIALAIWDPNYPQIDFIVEGLLKLPIVEGVHIHDVNAEKLYGKHGDIEQNYKLNFTDESGVSFVIGDITLYSDSSVIFNRVKNSYISIIIKTIALWIIVLYVGKKIISTPRTKLTEASQSIDLDNIETCKEADIGIPPEHMELAVLSQTFNQMVKNYSRVARN